MKDPESHRAHRGLDRAGVGNEGVVGGSTEAQRIVRAAEPPHGFGLRRDVDRASGTRVNASQPGLMFALRLECGVA